MSRRSRARHATLVALFLSGCSRTDAGPQTAHPVEPDTVRDYQPQTESRILCSFNIQFLGNFRRRDNASLADVVQQCDVVAVQELVAPPVSQTFADRTVNADPEAHAFVEEMSRQGFHWILSEEDTGPGEKNHLASAATEWYITFYRPERVTPAPELPRGFLARDRTANRRWDRVPYAFPFRVTGGRFDFVLVSVHLHPKPKGMERRRQELKAVEDWIRDHSGAEKDFFVLGDMNLQNCTELEAAMPASLASLNDNCLATNTNPNSGKPYDHVMYTSSAAAHIDHGLGMLVGNIVAAMRERGSYRLPEYDHTVFRGTFSDHAPVAFRILKVKKDEDP